MYFYTNDLHLNWYRKIQQRQLLPLIRKSYNYPKSQVQCKTLLYNLYP
nr:MAG TPA: hypothetical protein [Caudoviricetes sp.]